MPRGYRWGVQFAEKRNRKGRAMGGMVMEVREEAMEKGENIEVGEEGIITGRIKIGKDKWRIVGVYVNADMEGKLQSIAEWTEGREEEVKTLIGGDFMPGQEIEEEGWIVRRMRREKGKGKGDRRTKRSIKRCNGAPPTPLRRQRITL